VGWSVLQFGKHAGKTLPQVLFSDPDWFFWAYERNLFSARGHSRDEVEAIYTKARAIRVPDSDGGDLVVEYYGDPISGKFAALEVVPREQGPEGNTGFFRLNVFDLAAARHLMDYDKSGAKLLIRHLKEHLFGDPSYKMTKKRCEAFFDDDDNFDIDRGDTTEI